MSPKTAWNHKNVAHAWKIVFPYLLLRDSPWWVNKRGIFFLFKSSFVFQKNWKNCTWCQPLQNGGHYRGEYWSTRELRSWKVQKQVRFSSSCVFVWDVLASYLSPKTRSFYENLNSQRVFKKHQHFVDSKSNFGAFFQDKFSLCGITPNHLRFQSWLV